MLYPPLPVDSMINARDSKGEHRSIQTYPFDKGTPLPASVTWDGRYYVSGKYQDVDWMFWVGEFDKNKKEIYDGDIVLLTNISECCGKVTSQYKTVVTFEYGGFWMKEAGEDGGLFGFGGVAKDREVIGNKYENSNLLKGD